MNLIKRIIAPLILAIGILGMGLAIKAGIDNFAFSDRVVSVRGLAERTVMADQVTWPVSYAITGDDLPSLYDLSKANNETVLAFLTSNGIPRKDISINPPDVHGFEADKAFAQPIALSQSRQLIRRQVNPRHGRRYFQIGAQSGFVGAVLENRFQFPFSFVRARFDFACQQSSVVAVQSTFKKRHGISRQNKRKLPVVRRFCFHYSFSK